MRILAVALLALITLPRAVPAGDASGAYAPYEDLLEVLADLTWHLHDDTYRFLPPKDPTGHDLYQLALRRLEHWEKRYPGRLRDVTAFARAEALEHLGEYAAAADLYRQVTTMGSPLSERARQGAERSNVFVDAARRPESGDDLEATLAAMRAKLDAWAKVVKLYTGTPHEARALVEEERLERLTARLVVENRRALANGPESSERALRFLIEKHADSKELPRHILHLADLYAELARDYVTDHERPLAFDAGEFTRRADRALDTYRKVATWDGSREKPEAQARFAAFDAYKSSILSRYQ